MVTKTCTVKFILVLSGPAVVTFYVNSVGRLLMLGQGHVFVNLF